MTDRPTEAPSAAAEGIVSPIYDQDVIFEGVVVSRADLERLTTERDDATARADGYALLVAKMSGHLVHVIDAGTNGGGWAEWECRVCLATWFGAADAKPQIVHESGCLLAADPEARARELGAAQKAGAP